LTGRFLAGGGVYMKLQKIKKQTAEYRYSLFQSFFSDLSGRSATSGSAEPRTQNL